ncbi:nucleotidyltransferase [Mycobacteroides abscessus]|uniref:nucleotidyltransferase n=1 Tax=Mycobacteroides abscessus TaxID=36809 RepID=UPI0009A8B1C4|nr:DUF6036 family nucleotidyltransferase [Mycobacteroides abscessus]SKK33476.1 Nucleotidyl transferase of uncharacterised function (DUF2204) [Mycobacteroides abscessus subsp. abscessus]
MELWSSERAAEHFGVTPGRARSLLTSRGIHRISGYPAAAVRAVQLRQGNRTDLHPIDLATALSIDDAAAAIAAAAGEADRLRVFFEFLRGADAAGPAALLLVAQEPCSTGDARFDALLAAAAEHLAARYGLPGPLWTALPERFLDRAWWISDLPSASLLAIKWTPASFVRRGIYLDAHDLTQDGTTPMPDPVLFDQPAIREAFHLLATKLQRRNIIGHVHVIGGAAMLLAYNSRTITRDIDAVFASDGPVVDAVREIAREKQWPTKWLNNQAAAYAARNPGEGMTVFEHPHLQVMATPAEHLLAMKVLAARAVRDADDALILLKHLNIRTTDAVWQILGRYFTDTMISDRTRLFVDAIMGSTGGSR